MGWSIHIVRMKVETLPKRTETRTSRKMKKTTATMGCLSEERLKGGRGIKNGQRLATERDREKEREREREREVGEREREREREGERGRDREREGEIGRGREREGVRT